MAEYLNQINMEAVINTQYGQGYVKKIQTITAKLGAHLDHYSQRLGPKISFIPGGPTGIQVVYEPGIFGGRRGVKPL